MRAQARQALGLRERRLRNLERVQARAQLEQEGRVEAGADLSGKAEVFLVTLRLLLRAPRVLPRGEVADEERAEADALALRIGEAADDERVPRLALHLQPALRPAMLVLRVAALGDDTFPPFGTRALPGFGTIECDRVLDRQLQRQIYPARRDARRVATLSDPGR